MSVIDFEQWRKKLEKASPSRSKLQQTMWSDQTGRKPTKNSPLSDLDLNREDIETLVAFVVVLDRAHLNPFTIQSNFAREAAQFVAICASEGLISVRLEEDTWGDRWLITPEGLMCKENMKDVIRQISEQNASD